MVKEPFDRNPPLKTGLLRTPGDDETVWRVDYAEKDRLQGWLQKHWPHVLSDPRGIVKEDKSTRVVIRDGLVLKEYKRKDQKGGGRLLPARAGLSFNHALRLSGKVAGVVRPVAWTVQRRCGMIEREFLVSPALENIRPLSEILDETDDAGAGSGLILELGALLGRLHVAGYTHRDLKDGNILVTRVDDALKLHLVDMDGFFRPLVLLKKRRIKDFAPLLHSLALHGWDTPEMRRNLLAGYHRHKAPVLSPDELPVIARDIPCRRPGWQAAIVTMNRSGMKRRSLHLYTPGEPGHWRHIAHRYWQGRLPGLQPLPSDHPGTAMAKGKVPGDDSSYIFRREQIASAKRLCRLEGVFADIEGIGDNQRLVCLLEERCGRRLVARGMILRDARP